MWEQRLRGLDYDSGRRGEGVGGGAVDAQSRIDSEMRDVYETGGSSVISIRVERGAAEERERERKKGRKAVIQEAEQ